MHSLMDSSSIMMVVILVILIIFSAFFSATETAMASFNRIRIKNKAEDGNKRAKLVLSYIDKYDRMLSCILIANNIVNISAASLATVLFLQYFPIYGATISTIVLTCAILIFGEITPKSLAKDQPERFALFAAPLLRIFLFLLAPLNFLFSLFYKLAAKLLHTKAEEGITEEELITMVEEAENEGGLEPHESQLILAAIEFNDLAVMEILTPRVDIVAVDKNASMDTLELSFVESGYSRIPIYDNNIDNIVGVIHEKDFYAARYRHRHISDFSSLIGEVLYTTGNSKISSLLQLLQRSKTHMAIVVDEYGGTLGLVTLEDILEELVGEIWDEHDEVLEEFKKQEDGSYLISCSADLDDLFDRFSLHGETNDSNSISAWVLETLGHIPVVGDHFVYENLDVTVTKVDNRRVLEIRVALIPQEDSDTEIEKEEKKSSD